MTKITKKDELPNSGTLSVFRLQKQIETLTRQMIKLYEQELINVPDRMSIDEPPFRSLYLATQHLERGRNALRTYTRFINAKNGRYEK